MKRTWVACLALILATETNVLAQPDERRAEAAERFDRGLRHFDEGNLAAALAELQKAHSLVPNPVVELNVGLVQAAMGRAVDAVATLDRVLAAPGALSAAKVEQARRVRDEQAARIGELVIHVTTAGATIEIDGIPAGKSPLPAPVRVASGEHVVQVLAPGHAPARKPVVIAGRERKELALELTPMEGRPGWVAIRAAVPAVDVRLDGEPVGKTPLPGPIAVAPGKRRVELRRPGYRAAQQEIPVAEGATADVTFALEEDPTGPRGRLALVPSESDASVWIDGVARGAVTVLELPVGLHRLRAERAGFLAIERDVDVSPGGDTVRLGFEPTPETRASYTGRARAHRTWGIVATAAGGALVLGGAGYLLYNRGVTSDRRDAFFALSAEFDPGGRCDRARGLDSDACHAELDATANRYDAAKGRNVYGYVAIGAGAASLATGIFLLATGNDPHRYDPKPMAFAPAFVRGGGLAAVTGSFLSGIAVSCIRASSTRSRQARGTRASPRSRCPCRRDRWARGTPGSPPGRAGRRRDGTSARTR